MMMPFRGRNMKIILGLAMFWLLCGMIAAGLMLEVRPATLRDVALGPVNLLRVVTAEG